MTSLEVMLAVRMLLDDTRDWFPSTAEIIRSVNEAQMKRVHLAYSQQDERALRPLYAFNSDLKDGDEVVYNTRRLLYPRSCRIKHLDTLTDDFGQSVAYKDQSLYTNFFFRSIAPTTTTFPRNSYYTIVYAYNAGYKSYIKFQETDGAAAIWFIYEPPDFTFTGTPLTDQTLSLPSEYHFEICAMAAELLNNADVNEMERSQVAFQNQKNDIEKVSIIG